MIYFLAAVLLPASTSDWQTPGTGVPVPDVPDSILQGFPTGPGGDLGRYDVDRSPKRSSAGDVNLEETAMAKATAVRNIRDDHQKPS